MTIAVAGVLSYIWMKLKTIYFVLTNLPFGIGKFISSALTSLFERIGLGKLFGESGIFSKFSKGMMSILKFIPGFDLLFGQFSKAARLGNLLGKAFFFFGMAFDAIYGAYKGFKELGNVKGILMGAVSGLVSFFTFGLLDFKTTFDLLNTYMGDFFNELAGVVQPFVDFIKEAYYQAMEAWGKVIAIFQGEGSFISKIGKALQVAITYAIKGAIAFIGAVVKALWSAFKALIQLVIVMPFKIGYWLGEQLVAAGEMIYKIITEDIPNAFKSLYDYITSGEILSDLWSGLKWIFDSITDVMSGAINAVADGLGDLPIVGSYIKEALGGGSGGDSMAASAEKTAKTVEDARKAAEVVAKNPAAPKAIIVTQPDGTSTQIVSGLKGTAASASMSSTATYSANSVNTAANTASTAQYQATTSTGTVAINAPTTNVAGGGGGESVMLTPSNNRNTEPTFRSLLFMEAPAM